MRAKASRTEETRNWKIPNKFMNDDFVNSLSVLFHLEENHEAKNQRSIEGKDSVQEWIVRRPRTCKEEDELIEAGFETKDSVLKYGMGTVVASVVAEN